MSPPPPFLRAEPSPVLFSCRTTPGGWLRLAPRRLAHRGHARAERAPRLSAPGQGRLPRKVLAKVCAPLQTTQLAKSRGEARRGGGGERALQAAAG